MFCVSATLVHIYRQAIGALALITVLAICTDSLEGIGTEEIQYCSGEQELFYFVGFWTESSPNWPFFWSLTESKSKLTVVLVDNRGSGLSSLGKMRTKCPQPRSVKKVVSKSRRDFAVGQRCGR